MNSEHYPGLFIVWFVGRMLRSNMPHIKLTGARLKKFMKRMLNNVLLIFSKQCRPGRRHIKKKLLLHFVCLLYQRIAQANAKMIQPGIGIFCPLAVK